MFNLDNTPKIISFLFAWIILLELIYNSEYDNLICYSSLIFIMIIIIIIYCLFKK